RAGRRLLAGERDALVGDAVCGLAVVRAFRRVVVVEPAVARRRAPRRDVVRRRDELLDDADRAVALHHGLAVLIHLGRRAHEGAAGRAGGHDRDDVAGNAAVTLDVERAREAGGREGALDLADDLRQR